MIVFLLTKDSTVKPGQNGSGDEGRAGSRLAFVTTSMTWRGKQAYSGATRRDLVEAVCRPIFYDC